MERQRKRPRLEEKDEALLLRLPDEILLVVFFHLRSHEDVVSTSLTCRRLSAVIDDEELWKAFFHRWLGVRPLMTIHHAYYGKSWKWLATVESLPRDWPRSVRVRSVAAYFDDHDTPFQQRWRVGDCIFREDQYGAPKPTIHGYGYAYNQMTESIVPSHITPRVEEGLWWQGRLCETPQHMPRYERGRADLNRPFDPETTADGTGYALFGPQNERTFYKGEWKNHLPDGRGRLFRQDGYSGSVTLYDGGWRNGQYHGHGIYIDRYKNTRVGWFFDGVYEGENGKIKHVERSRSRAGHVRVWFADGRVFQGEDDLHHGRMEYPDGSVYVGGFFRGKRQAGGVLFFNSPDWRRYEGTFSGGSFHGDDGKMDFSDGTRVKGRWEMGRFDASRRHKIRHPNEPHATCGACRFLAANS